MCDVIDFASASSHRNNVAEPYLYVVAKSLCRVGDYLIFIAKLYQYSVIYPQAKKEDRSKERPKWDNQIEFLMSCIATSVGLGNVWRFPFVAYQNGGGAFLIPYVIVLLVIGKPMYYLETVLGQFSSSNCVKIWRLSPAMKGT